MNNVSIIGRLGNDPEMKYFESGKAKTKINVAVKGIKKDEVIWVEVQAWDKLAELIGEYFKKGSQIGINGRLAIDEWEQEGQKKSKTYIIAENIDFLGKKEN